MANVELGQVIAERALHSAELPEGITVRIECPQKTEHGDFVTPYQMIGIGEEKVRYGAGVDAVQALQLAFQKLGAEIQFGLKEYNLRWLDGDDAGFPTP